MIESVALQVPCFTIFCWLVWKLGRFAILQLVETIAKGFATITAELGALRVEHGRRLERIEDHLDIDFEDDEPTPTPGR